MAHKRPGNVDGRNDVRLAPADMGESMNILFLFALGSGLRPWNRLGQRTMRTYSDSWPFIIFWMSIGYSAGRLARLVMFDGAARLALRGSDFPDGRWGEWPDSVWGGTPDLWGSGGIGREI
jgi:hypothetical protein